jgi:hypothetical protein
MTPLVDIRGIASPYVKPATTLWQPAREKPRG